MATCSVVDEGVLATFTVDAVEARMVVEGFVVCAVVA